MKSKLNINEFTEKLKNNIEIGSLKLKLSPFGLLFSIFENTSKPFYGTFNNSVFSFTMNSMIPSTFYIIKGKYKTINGILEIDYQIIPITKFHLIWIKYFPVVALISINLIFICSKIVLEAYILPNFAIFLMLFFSRWDMKLKKKNLEQKFKEIFEIIE